MLDSHEKFSRKVSSWAFPMLGFAANPFVLMVSRLLGSEAK